VVCLRLPCEHDLVGVGVREADALDLVSDDGLQAVGPPTTYPRDASRSAIAHERCRPIGQAA
jgi:hypothetical protein